MKIKLPALWGCLMPKLAGFPLYRTFPLDVLIKVNSLPAHTVIISSPSSPAPVPFLKA